MIITVEVIVVMILIFVNQMMKTYLDFLNRGNVLLNSKRIPDSLKGIAEESTYFKSINYTLAKIRFGFFEDYYSSIILGLIILFALIPKVFSFFTNFVGISVWGQSFAFIMTLIIFGIPNIPFEWYSQFVIEEKFGFNKSTKRLWITDNMKEYGLSIIIGCPLMALILWFFDTFNNSWWLLAFSALVVFQLLMLILYPNLILPLFNKLTPLADGELRDRLIALSDRSGFKSSTIQVIDGSKRSSHSNAYFTGFGRFRRIVLFDTLIDQLSIAELEAVLAHEIGHYKKKHIMKLMLVMFISLFVALYIVNYLVHAEWFYSGFGLEKEMGVGPVLMLFLMLFGLVTFWFTPFSNFFSRRYEYEADAFAKKICGSPNDLISALRKMHTKNLGNLTPHKLYSRFYYSHPTLLERESGLRNENSIDSI